MATTITQGQVVKFTMNAAHDVAPNGDFYTMLPAPDVAYQKHIQIRTRWFDEVERVMRVAKQ